jgi:hypothetical protein
MGLITDNTSQIYRVTTAIYNGTNVDCLRHQPVQQTRTALALGWLYHTVRFTNCRRLRMTDLDVLVTTITTRKNDLKSIPQQFTTQARQKML